MALAQAVPDLPDGPGWWYEPKYDGHRTVLRRTDETVMLYARSGRVVTQHWMDLAVAAMELRPGTVLDGEAVIWRDGRLDFAAAQSRAASSVPRVRALAARYPAAKASARCRGRRGEVPRGGPSPSVPARWPSCAREFAGDAVGRCPQTGRSPTAAMARRGRQPSRRPAARREQEASDRTSVSTTSRPRRVRRHSADPMALTP
ncbi:ATP-dependent DNA ligase [Streptomyces sp. NPDC001948]